MWRVMWQFGPSLMGTITNRIVPSLQVILDNKQLLWRDLNTLGDPEPVFSEHPAVLRSNVLYVSGLQSDPAMDLAGYAHVFLSTQQEAQTLVNRLSADSDVSRADMQRRWQYPVQFGRTKRFGTTEIPLGVPVPATPDLTAKQGYLAASPNGVDALYAWSIPGGAAAT